MAKLSVLDIVQDILSDMNSDEVSSISDTLESMQVAQIVKSVYDEMMARKNWPHLHKLIALSPVGASTPTHLALPVDIKEMLEVFYDKKKEISDPAAFEAVEWLDPSDFLAYTNSRRSDSSTTEQIIDPTTVPLMIKNNSAPTYFTTFDDEHIIFDSYDNTVDLSGVAASKVQCRAVVMPALVLSDDVTNIPDLPIEMFPAFLAECKSTCFARIKQMVDQKAEMQSKRSMSWLSRKAFQAHGGIKMPNYGRRGRR